MEDKLFSVKDQIVLIPGGSRGIGRAIANEFAVRDARVILAGREEETLKKTASEISEGAKPVEYFACDISKESEIDALVTHVVERHGRIDTLINVAGVNKRMKVENYTAEEYDWITDINARGAFMVAQKVGQQLIKQKAGIIINVDSLNTYAPLRGTTPYAMSKASVLMLTRGLANEWGRHGIRVNSIAPGFIITDLTRKVWEDKTMQAWGKENTPLERLGEVSDLTGAAIFLASQASKYMTGQTIRVDGGITSGFNWPIEL